MKKDSIIQIIGTAGIPTEGYGFQMLVHKNECIVIYLARNDGNNIFQQHSRDEKYMFYVKARTQYHLTLTKIPSFKKGEVITGLVELRSYPYYEKGTVGDEKRT